MVVSKYLLLPDYRPYEACVTNITAKSTTHTLIISDLPLNRRRADENCIIEVETSFNMAVATMLIK